MSVPPVPERMIDVFRAEELIETDEELQREADALAQLVASQLPEEPTE